MVNTRRDRFWRAAMSISAMPSAPNPDALSTEEPKDLKAHCNTCSAFHVSANNCVSSKFAITSLLQVLSKRVAMNSLFLRERLQGLHRQRIPRKRFVTLRCEIFYSHNIADQKERRRRQLWCMRQIGEPGAMDALLSGTCSGHNRARRLTLQTG